MMRGLTMLLLVLAVGCAASDSDSGGSSSSALAPSASPSNTSKLTGTVTSLNGSCPNLSFTVNSVRVVTDGGTEFEKIACTGLRNGLSVEVKGSMINGALMAREIGVEEQEEQREVRVTGTISGLGGSCPNLSFTVAGQRGLTNAATRFDDVTCSGLQNGLRVEVRGVLQPDGTMVVTRVKREDSH